MGKVTDTACGVFAGIVSPTSFGGALSAYTLCPTIVQSASLGISVNPVLRLLLRGEGRGFVGEDESIIDKVADQMHELSRIFWLA